MNGPEVIDTFDCFGSRCSVLVGGGGALGAHDAVACARRELLSWHGRFSRFLADSELSLLNEDPREEVPASRLMCRLAEAVRAAGTWTEGLVDATLLEQIEASGYAGELGAPLALASAIAAAPARHPAGPRAEAGWSKVELGTGGRSVRRPPGVKLDSGGLAKGLFADVIAAELAEHAFFAVDCAGDLAIGGAAGLPRPVAVESPFDGSVLHTFAISAGGVATSGIGRRSWLDERGRPAHHLLDPATGRPAFTGVVQATALAPSALEAEVYAKAAVLSGPVGARRWLSHGGLVVLDDGSHVLLEPPPVVTMEELAHYAR